MKFLNRLTNEGLGTTTVFERPQLVEITPKDHTLLKQYTDQIIGLYDDFDRTHERFSKPLIHESTLDKRTEYEMLVDDVKRGYLWLYLNQEQEEVVGLIYMLDSEFKDTGFLSMIIVKESEQNQGYGRYLLKAAERIAKKQYRWKNLLLGVSAANSKALKLYRSSGFGTFSFTLMKPLK